MAAGAEAGAPAPPPAAAPWRADLALVVAAFFFGTTFVVVQDAVEQARPLPFLAVRFLVGAAVLAAIGCRRPGRSGEVRDGGVAGLVLAAGYVAQTVGLQYTTAATSAFLTYLLVVLVPLLAWLALRRRPHPLTLAALVPAVAGLALLTGGAGAGLGRGEVLTLGCAVAFAAHIVILGQIAGRHDPIRLTAVQLAAVGGACLVPSVVTGGLALPGRAGAAAVATGLFATALAFVAMVWAQRIVSPSRAALVLLLEPVFAAALSWAAGDELGPGTAAGGALILLAVAVAEIGPAVTARRCQLRGAVAAG